VNETIHAPATHVTTVLSAPRLPTGTGPTIPAPPPIDRCGDCNGCGTRSAQTEWRGSVQDGERECYTCEGAGTWCPECENTGRVCAGMFGGKVVYVSGCDVCGRDGDS
jgi:hypothetical protein